MAHKYSKALILILLALTPFAANAQIIRTIAGNGTGGTFFGIPPAIPGDGGQSRKAVIARPYAVAVDSIGNLFVTDANNTDVRKVQPDGIISTFVDSAAYPDESGDGGPAISAHLAAPNGIAVSPKHPGIIYIADAGAEVVRAVDTFGIIRIVAGQRSSPGYSGDGGPATSAQLIGVEQIYFDTSGNLYIADNNCRIREVTNDGIIHTVVGSGSIGYGGDGLAATSTSVASANIDGVCVDRQGNIYISDYQNFVVRKITAATGIISLFAGTPGTSAYGGDAGLATAAKLVGPKSLAVDTLGNVYISDVDNNRIRKVDVTGHISTFCGTGTAGFTGDGGAPTSAKIAYQQGIWIDKYGNFYIADNSGGNAGMGHRVRQIYTPTIMHITDNLGTTSICGSLPNTFTAHSRVPGYGALYKWKVNGVSTFTSIETTFNTSSVGVGDHISCTLVDTFYTPNLVIATSDTLTVTALVSTVFPTVTISSTGDTTCSGSNVTFTPIPVMGGSTPVYSWYVNNAFVTTGNTYTYAPANGDSVQCTMASSLSCPTPANAPSNKRGITVNPILVPTVTISPSTGTDTVCGGTNITFTAIPVNGGAAPAYQWKVNSTAMGTSSATLSYTPINGDTVKCVLTSNYSCSSPVTANSNNLVFTVNPLLVPSVTIAISGGDSVCVGSTKTLTATPVNGGLLPLYHWTVNGTLAGTGNPFTYTPTNGDVVNAELYSSACTATDSAASNNITIAVLPYVTTSIAIAGTNPVCNGASVTYTATPTNGGATPGYNWYKNGSAVSTASSYTITPANGDVISCVLTSSLLCPSPDTAVSPVITMTVIPIPTPSLSIAANTADTVCTGTNVTYTPTPVNGGASPVYTWYKNGLNVATGGTYTTVPSDADNIYCLLASSMACASPDSVTSNAITMTINPLLTPFVDVSMSTGDTICAGTTVTYTATAINGGADAAVTWLKNGINVATGNMYVVSPNNGDIILCGLSADPVCPTTDTATSDTIAMIVNPILTPVITISANTSDTICNTTVVTYTAVTINGGSSPGYIWKTNGVVVSTGAVLSYAPADGDTVTCDIVSSAPCAMPDTVTSNAIIMSVIPTLTPAIAITITPADTVCTGTHVSFSSAIENGGTAPVYNWYKNGALVTTDTAYAYTPANGDIIKCTLTSNAVCPLPAMASSNAYVLKVLTTDAPGINIATASDTVCSGLPITYTSDVTGGAVSDAVYNWEVNRVPTGTGVTFVYTPADGDTISCIATVLTPCSLTDTATIISNDIVMHVIPTVIPSVSIAAIPGDTVCAGTPVTYSATTVNGGGSHNYTWYKNGVWAPAGSGSTYLDVPADGDSVYCVFASTAVCAMPDTVTSNTVNMVVYPLLTSVSIAAEPGDTVCAGTSVTYTATPVNGGATPTYVWYKNGTNDGTGNTYTTVPSDADVINCVLTSSAPCVMPDTALSASIVMTVHPMLTPTVSEALLLPGDTVCAGTVVTFTATATNTGATYVFTWFKNGTSVSTGGLYTFTPVDGDVVVCQLVGNPVCPTTDTATSDATTITVNPILHPAILITATGGDTVCAGTSVTYTSSAIDTGLTPAYAWYKNGDSVAAGNTYTTTPVNGDHIYCMLTSSGPCAIPATVMSDTVTMTVNPLLTPTVSTTLLPNDTVCAGTVVNFSATGTDTGTAPVYTWLKNSLPIATGDTFSFTPVNGDTIICVLTANPVCPATDTAISSPVIITVNPLLMPTVSITANTSDTICSTTYVTYTATITNGGTIPAYQWYKNGVAVGSDTSAYAVLPVNGDSISCVLITNVTCPAIDTAVSPAITMTVNTTLLPVISIIASADTVCAGTPVYFSAAIFNGGTAPLYHWYVNGSLIATDTPYSYTPANGDIVACVLVSNVVCPAADSVNSNPIDIIVTPLITPGITITTTDSSLCAGTVANFTSTITNSGTGASYFWLVNDTLTNTGASFSYAPANTDTVTCIFVTSGLPCAATDTAISNAITMTVAPTYIPSVTITATSGATLIAGTADTFTATVINGGSAPAYQWLVNGVSVSGATNATFVFAAPNNGDSVACVVISDIPCADPVAVTSNVMHITIETVVPVADYVTLSPNPGNGTFAITGYYKEANGNSADIAIMDIAGKMIYHTTIPVNNGNVNAGFTLGDDFPSGVYMLHIKYGGINQSIRFVIEK